MERLIGPCTGAVKQRKLSTGDAMYDLHYIETRRHRAERYMRASGDRRNGRLEVRAR